MYGTPSRAHMMVTSKLHISEADGRMMKKNPELKSANRGLKLLESMNWIARWNQPIRAVPRVQQSRVRVQQFRAARGIVGRRRPRPPARFLL